jgi:hypothetical protein
MCVRSVAGGVVLHRVVKIVLGVLLVAAGIAMLVLPGPGLLFIAGGVALILSQWQRGRRSLARVRVRMRDRYGSPRVRQVESRIPNEVCPPVPTEELKDLANSDIVRNWNPKRRRPTDVT